MRLGGNNSIQINAYLKRRIVGEMIDQVRLMLPDKRSMGRDFIHFQVDSLDDMLWEPPEEPEIHSLIDVCLIINSLPKNLRELAFRYYVMNETLLEIDIPGKFGRPVTECRVSQLKTEAKMAMRTFVLNGHDPGTPLPADNVRNMRG